MSTAPLGEYVLSLGKENPFCMGKQLKSDPMAKVSLLSVLWGFHIP